MVFIGNFARGNATSIPNTARQYARSDIFRLSAKPAAPGAAWSSSKACHAEMRHLSRHSPSPRPDGHFPSVAERDTARALPGGFTRGLHRGAFPGLFRGLHRGLHRGFTGAFPRGFTRAFPGLSRGLARGNAASIPNTARRHARTGSLRLPSHGAQHGLHRRLGARRCGVYPKHGPSTAGRTFSVCHRTGRGVVFIEGMPRGDAASISA